MRVGSLFSGIGGLDLGLERAGMEVIWQSEIDPYASKVLKKHWPAVPNLGDVTQIDWRTVERPDVICGGFPCQPVSYAGRRKGKEDDRWLWPHFERAIRLLRPRFVIVENVPGLLTQGMGDVLAGLARCGFDAEWDLLPAAAVGAPHLRYRVFIVAHRQEDSPRSDSNGFGSHRTEVNEYREAELRDEQERQSRSVGADVPDTHRRRFSKQQERDSLSSRVFQPSCRNDSFRRSSQGWWATEPDVGRVADGISSRVDRLRCLGNAVVPQVAEWVGRRLMERASA